MSSSAPEKLPLKTYTKLFVATFPEVALSGSAFVFSENGVETVSFSIETDVYVTDLAELLRRKARFQSHPVPLLRLLCCRSILCEPDSGDFVRFQVEYSYLDA